MDLKLVLKKAFRPLGFDLVRLKNVPRVTFLGLTNRPYDSVLDVGANDGGFAKWIVRLLPGARLFCFEPLPAPAEALRKWAARRHRTLEVHEVALSDVEGEAEFIEHLDHSTSSSLLPTTAENVALFPFMARVQKRRVTVTTLDAWAAHRSTDLGRILLKLDVQGTEEHVLRGGINTLQAVDACLVEVNIAHLYEGQAAFATLVDLLHAAGLSYYGNLDQIHDDRGAPLFVDCAFVRREA